MTDHPIADLILRGRIAPGVYRVAGDVALAPVAAALSAQGWRVFEINGKMIEDKAAFLQAVGQAMAFPAYAGHNWDAFEELITDLSWAPAPGYAILYDGVYPFASAQPDNWKTARAILQSAVAEWRKQHIPMFVLLRKNWNWNRDLPALSAE